MKPSPRSSRLEWGFRAALVLLALLWMLYPPHASSDTPGEPIRVVQP